MERCPSGRRGSPAKGEWDQKFHRGFESLPLRHVFSLAIASRPGYNGPRFPQGPTACCSSFTAVPVGHAQQPGRQRDAGMEGWPSGRWHLLGKQANRKVSGVRIPFPPPFSRVMDGWPSGLRHLFRKQTIRKGPWVRIPPHPPCCNGSGACAEPRCLRVLSSVGRALLSHSKGHWFEPSRTHHVLPDYPSGQRELLRKQSGKPFAGSNPVSGTKFDTGRPPSGNVLQPMPARCLHWGIDSSSMWNSLTRLSRV